MLSQRKNAMSTKNNNTHLIVLSVGDADNGDGHGKNKKFYVMTNRGSDQIAEAYEHGVNVIGVDIEELTRECDASKIDAKSIAKLSRSGFDVSGIDPDFSINAKRYVQIFMHIAVCGSAVLTDSPEPISWDFASVDKLDIGGYGLFD